MKKRRIAKAFLMLSLLACMRSPADAQQVAGSVEVGLQTLAEALVANTPRDQSAALSVLPFPGADQSCPVLSVFVVDEMTTLFITTVKPRPRVVERQQLEAVIAQNQLQDFLTDPEQRKRLGGLSGIGAVVLGTYATIGDRLRINARVVAIGSGETISAAAVSVPLTAEISALLRQQSGRGRNCLAERAPGARAAGGSAAAQTGRAPSQSALNETCEEQGSARVCVAEFRVNGPVVQLNLSVENTSDAAIAVAAVGPIPSLTDNDGTKFGLQKMDGLPLCGRSFDHNLMRAQFQDECVSAKTGYLKRSAFRGLPPGARAGLSLQFRAEQPSESQAFTLTGALAILPKLPASMAATEAEKMDAQPLIFMLPNIRP